MAEDNQNKYETPQSSDVEVQDRGVFDFLGKKKEQEKPQEEVIATEFDQKVTVSEEAEKKQDEGEKKHTLLEKLHRSDSSSSSVSACKNIYNNLFIDHTMNNFKSTYLSYYKLLTLFLCKVSEVFSVRCCNFKNFVFKKLAYISDDYLSNKQICQVVFLLVICKVTLTMILIN